MQLFDWVRLHCSDRDQIHPRPAGSKEEEPRNRYDTIQSAVPNYYINFIRLDWTQDASGSMAAPALHYCVPYLEVKPPKSKEVLYTH